MEPTLRMLGVWSGVAFFVIWAIGFCVLAGWLPPTPPSLSSGEVASLFQADSVSIRIGMVLMSAGSVFYLPWTAVLSDLIKQMEGKSFFLTFTQLAAGVIGQITFFLPAYFWAAAAFRPERNPEITQMIADVGWLLFMTPFAPFMLQYFTLAAAILTDKQATPMFPRWAGYMQIWVGVSFLPAALAFFMKTGPFAWNGVFVWWIPASLFTVWFVIMVVLCRKVILKSTGELQ